MPLSLRGFAVAQSEVVYFTHGVASGDPLADRYFVFGYCQALANPNGETTAGGSRCGIYRYCCVGGGATDATRLYRESRCYRPAAR